MKRRIMIHYAVSFFIAAFILVLINVLYMSNSIYQNEELYHFSPDPYMNRITEGIYADASSEIVADPELAIYLENEGIGFQLIDQELKEVIQLNNHFRDTQDTYSPEELIRLYESPSTTAFISAQHIDDRDYTLLLFMDPDAVSRKQYTYNVDLVDLAYNPIWLVGMNLFLLLFISYIYALRISRPVNLIGDRIIRLSEGHYETKKSGKGLFETVENALNTLSSQLETSHQERALAEVTREEWISNLSHDIKTPLTSIIGYGELLGDPEYLLSAEEREKYRTIILEKGTYIENLLNDLNLAMRLKHHQLPLHLESVDLIAEIKTILIDVVNTKFNELDLSFTHTADEVHLSLDRRLFKRVMLNLIHNAIVHNEKPVSVLVHLDADDPDWVTLSIEDDGIGVDPDEQPRLFTRYYRGTHTKKTSEGSGLGLAIAKDIILAHEGSIDVRNSPQGGLRIILKLKK